MFQTESDFNRHLQSLGLFSVDLSLARMGRALQALHCTHVPSVSVQVVGTNGKGSTSAFLASLAHAHGLRVGLYTSPHFVHVHERIRINGQPLPLESWLHCANAAYAAEPTLTYFELLTVMAALAFAHAKVDIAIFEAGMGGKFDATTALPSHLVCMTPIDIDHQAYLGDTLALIAAEKACALRPHGLAITATQQPEVCATLHKAAQTKHCRLHTCFASVPLPPLGLRGLHQQENARLALSAWRLLRQHFFDNDHQHKIPHSPEMEQDGLAKAFLPGRMQFIPATPALPHRSALPPLILDGAHNPHGLQALRHALTAERIRLSALIFSCMMDKDIKAMCPLLLDIAQGAPIYTPTIQDNPRAASGAHVAQCLGGPTAQAVLTLEDALQSVQHIKGQPILLCGSLYLLGEFFTRFPEYLSRQD